MPAKVKQKIENYNQFWNNKVIFFTSKKVLVSWLRSYWANRNGELPMISYAFHIFLSVFHKVCLLNPSPQLLHNFTDFRSHCGHQLRWTLLQWVTVYPLTYSDSRWLSPAKNWMNCHSLPSSSSEQTYSPGKYLNRKCRFSHNGHELRTKSLPRKATSQKKKWYFYHYTWNEHCFTYFSDIFAQDTVYVYTEPV